MDTFPASLQRPALQEFAAALCSRDNAIKRDECGDWQIAGAAGHVYAYAPGRFQFFVFTPSARAWGFAKAALDFAMIQNDGDEEGGYLLDRLPTRPEAAAIRRYCGIEKKRELSDESLIALRAQFAAVRSPGFARAA